MKTKKELLEHYSTGDIHSFIQFDGWKMRQDQSDSVMKPDKNGYVWMAGYTEELRHSPKELAVRVLIHSGTSIDDTTKLLKGIIKWINRDKNLLEMADEHSFVRKDV
jgi:hypothetical protein